MPEFILRVGTPEGDVVERTVRAGSLRDAREEMVRFRTLSAPGLLFLVLTITFAVTDWVMSLDPHWFSTIFGLLFVSGYGLSAFALTIAVLATIGPVGALAGRLTSRHFHDLGKLLLAFTMLWAYMNFSQFLIIWSGNLPEEIPWYIERMRGGWGVIAILLGRLTGRDERVRFLEEPLIQRDVPVLLDVLPDVFDIHLDNVRRLAA